jgi:lipid A ethanolaminephosphotransferase
MISLFNNFKFGNLLKFILYFSIYTSIIFSSPFLIKYFSIESAIFFQSILELLKNFFYIFVAIFLLSLGLSINKKLFFGAFIILYLLSATNGYYAFFNGIRITPQIINVVMNNDVKEASEMLSYKIIFLNILYVFLLFIAYKTSPSNFKIYTNWKKFALVTVALISIYNLAKPVSKFFYRFAPWQITSSIYSYFFIAEYKDKLDISKQYKLDYSKSEDDKIIVLVIGESARGDHFQLNNYHRETNPLLSRNTKLKSFKAKSCKDLTYLSVECMLIKEPSEKFFEGINQTSVISIFNKIGFSTAWIGTQSLTRYYSNKKGGSFYDELSLVILPGGSALYQMNDHDEVMFPIFKKLLSTNGDKFIILHTSGSHWDYAQRHTSNFEKFHPICKKSIIGKRDYSDCSKEELINMYDNSILYTDYFLNEIISLIKDKNAFMIYASDHGESLGENGIYGHGSGAPEQYNIPIIFWTSDKFSKTLNINKNLENKELSHNYIFHSLLGCSGIKSDLIDKNYSICE